MKTVFLLVGESSSGKDSLAKLLELDGYKILKSYATRPRRINEGDTHIFITKDEVQNYKDDVVAYTKIGEYEYFSTRKQLNEVDVYIIDPNGVEYMKSKINDIKFITIFINVHAPTRFNRAINRKDKPEEIEKRFKAESEQFKKFKEETLFNYSVENYNINKAYNILKHIVEVEKDG